MLNAKRVLAAVLAALMLASSFASCSEAPAEDTTAAADTTAAPLETTLAAETEPPETLRTEIKDSLPEDLNFEGRTFTFYVAMKDPHERYVTGSDTYAGEVVNEAVWERNANVQDQLNFTMASEGFARTYDTIAGAIMKLVRAGDTTYDVFMGHQYGVTSLVFQKYFVNAYELDHINFDQPWWMNNFMDEISLGKNARYLLVSDFNTQTLGAIKMLYFNKALYEKIYGDPDELYKETLDGNFTFDRLNTLVAGAYADLDGNGRVDLTDQLGYLCNQLFAATDGFVFGSGVPFTIRDEEGFVQFNMLTEEAAQLCEDLNAFFHQTALSSNGGNNVKQLFTEGRVLFVGGDLDTAISLREMEDDFGFLPQPKYSENQKDYFSLVHDQALLSCVSASSQNLDMAGAVLEALAAESYRRVTPAWYETALKVKYARDDISSQMVDLIRASMNTNFLFAYNSTFYGLNGLGMLYRDLITNNSNAYTSTATSRLPASQKKLDELIDAYKAQ